jgi:hypothetical protein
MNFDEDENFTIKAEILPWGVEEQDINFDSSHYKSLKIPKT